MILAVSHVAANALDVLLFTAFAIIAACIGRTVGIFHRLIPLFSLFTRRNTA
jgi:hypothetical protein